jgi:hemoglobin-like flavoprotein
MTMHPPNKTQIRIIRASFEAVRPLAETAGELFYRRLFELAPRLRPLFTSDISAQGHRLMNMLALVVENLDRPEQLLPLVRQLGARHACYGVEAAHYAVVGQALLWTLAQGLNEGFTPEVEAAWAAAYGFLSGVMMEAAGQQLDASQRAA